MSAPETENFAIGLCLSGGGFRATFFHLGLIRFLRRYGLLKHVKKIASVSGGSVLAAHLVLNWSRYTSTDDAEYAAAERELGGFGSSDVRGRVVRRWLFSIVFPVLRLFPATARRTHLLEREYANLLNGALLHSIEPGPEERPVLHLLTTSFTTGNLCSFSSEGFWSHDGNAWKLYRASTIPLALAVASSSAFPPLFPPTAITRKMLDARNAELPYDPEFLTDGGVYDNLGFALFAGALGSSGDGIDHLVISDAGAQLDWDIEGRFTRVISRTIRSTDILMQRVADFTVTALRSGTVGLKVFHLTISRLVFPSALHKPLLVDFQKKLAKIRTDLDRFSSFEIECLVQHGDEVALAELRSLVESHPEFERLTELSSTAGSPLDVTSSAIPTAARELNKSRVRRVGLFDVRDWMSYTLCGYLLVVASIATFPYIYVAQRAVEGDLFRPGPVRGMLEGRDGRKSTDISGIACRRDAGRTRNCLLVDDNSQYAQFAQLNDSEIIAGPRIKLIDNTFNGKPLEFDGEGVAVSNESFYVIGSHGYPRGGRQTMTEEELRARVAATRQIVRFKSITRLEPTPDVERTSRLSDIIAAEPALAPFMDKLPDSNGVTIEGIAIGGKTLFAGFRAPILNESRAAILGVSVDALFSGSGTAHQLFRLPLGGRGVRDLATFEDHVLILAGPSSSAPGSYAIYSWDGKSDDAKLITELPFDPARKPEGLLPLDREGQNQLRVLVMFDGEKEGAPTPIKIELP